MTGVDFNSSEPFYKQLADLLRRQIQQGELQPGARLPSERELMETYQVSRTTVRLSIGELANESHVVRGQGRGTFVRERPPVAYLASLSRSKARRDKRDGDSFQADLAEQGRTGHQQITVETVQPTPDMRQRLRLGPEELVVIRGRVHVVDGRVTQTGDSVFPHRLVQDTEIVRADDVSRGTDRVLEELGHAPAYFVDEIAVRMPNAEERERLRIGDNIPVAVVSRVALDENEIPVELTVYVMPGDRNLIVYEVSAR